MIWSFSSSRTFRQCQRWWYFKDIFASAIAKDPLRNEAHRMSKLQSVSAWRGHIVDDVISGTLVRALRQRRPVTLPQLLDAARSQFDRGRAGTGAGEPAAKESPRFRSREYGIEITDGEFDSAWADIETALRGLFVFDDLRRRMKTATHLVAQRPLMFRVGGVSVRSVPDLIIFSEGTPLIVDWKVHFQPVHDYRLQLALYALALTRATRHADFPAVPPDATHIELVEAQLLTGEQRRYELTDHDVDAVETYVASTSWQMQRALDGGTAATLRPEDFTVTKYAESCLRCPFQRLCWERPRAA